MSSLHKLDLVHRSSLWLQVPFPTHCYEDSFIGLQGWVGSGQLPFLFFWKLKYPNFVLPYLFLCVISFPTNIRSQWKLFIVTTILTIRIRCPKTVNLFNKAHQHMRGTSCTKFTGWNLSLLLQWLSWLSWTHTWHKANKNIIIFFFFNVIFNNRDNLLFHSTVIVWCN